LTLVSNTSSTWPLSSVPIPPSSCNPSTYLPSNLSIDPCMRAPVALPGYDPTLDPASTSSFTPNFNPQPNHAYAVPNNFSNNFTCPTLPPSLSTNLASNLSPGLPSTFSFDQITESSMSRPYPTNYSNSRSGNSTPSASPYMLL
jgi:hypothetical protein